MLDWKPLGVIYCYFLPIGLNCRRMINSQPARWLLAHVLDVYLDITTKHSWPQFCHRLHRESEVVSWTPFCLLCWLGLVDVYVQLGSLLHNPWDYLHILISNVHICHMSSSKAHKWWSFYLNQCQFTFARSWIPHWQVVAGCRIYAILHKIGRSKSIFNVWYETSFGLVFDLSSVFGCLGSYWVTCRLFHSTYKGLVVLGATFFGLYGSCRETSLSRYLWQFVHKILASVPFLI